MKALTLTQPWATLVAISAKRVETRGWRSCPTIEGTFAIHAGAGLGGLKTHPAERVPGVQLTERLRGLCATRPFRDQLASVARGAGGQLLPGGDVDWADRRLLPRGAIVAVARIQGVEPTAMVAEQIAAGRVTGYGTVGQHELAFGDYAPGRLAIFLEHVVALPRPVACPGMLGFWDVPDVVEREVQREVHRAYELASAPLGVEPADTFDGRTHAPPEPAAAGGVRDRTAASGGAA